MRAKAVFCLVGWGLGVLAQADEALPEVVVPGRGDDLVGVAHSATQGTVGADELRDRPVARPAEVLETVPGMIITQHAGGGKANQYYLRGFNLDHGTDFAFFVDGVPINLTTQAHGQGYTDLNWLIPELVKGIGYQKGVYYPDQGDFANTGSASIQYFDVLPQSLATVQGGTLGYGRVVTGASPQLGPGHLLYGVEYEHYDGPWSLPNAFQKFNGNLKYSIGDDKHGFSLAGQGYYGKWRGTDQVPQRAIDTGAIDRFGALDGSPGGDTHRASVYGEFHDQSETASTKVVAYAVHYGLDLFSNFTYYIDQTNSDEFEQAEDRIYAGVRAQHTRYGKLLGLDMENTVGLQARQDWVTAHLDRDNQRVQVQHISTNKVTVLNLAPWLQNVTRWSSLFRSEAGLRADGFYLSDAADYPGNSGHQSAGAVSPKLSFVLGPWNKTEFYLQGGLGFRTNDTRGVFTQTAPDTGTPSRQLPAIVHSRGAEIGVRSAAVKKWNTTLSFWSLANDSDTFFASDSGSLVDTDRPSLRTGIEWTNYYTPVRWLTLDADCGYSWAFFTDDKPGVWVPEAVRAIASGAVSVRRVPGLGDFFGSLRFRYFGPRALIEDNSQQSASVMVFNLLAGYDINKTWSVTGEMLNLFNAKYNDAEYYSQSRLKNEVAGPNADGSYDDHMIHPGDPLSVRVAVTARF